MDKSNLTRITSPEELDQQLVVVSSKGWIALILTCLLILGGIFWAIFGSIPDTYDTQAIFLHTGGYTNKKGDFYFFSFIPIERGQQLQKGMKAYIKPADVDPQQYGSLVGSILSVSPSVATEQELYQLLGNHALISYFTDNQPVVIVTIEPIEDQSTKSGYKWTSGFGPPYTITPLIIGDALIVLSARPPISYVIPFWKAKKIAYSLKKTP
jgi:hypothetical protein